MQIEKRYIDATVTVGINTPVWPTDPKVKLERVSSIDDGAPCNLTHLHMSAHSGTHLDAPNHFIANGITVDKIPLETLIGRAFVRDLGDFSGPIDQEHLEGIPQCERLILRTGNTLRGLMSWPEFVTDYTHIGESGARWIVDSGIRLVGIDYLSVEGFETGSHIVHDILLGAGVIAVEGLNLMEVESGWWNLICLPLPFQGSDGSPARVVFEGPV